MERAAAQCEVVVATLFVNPLQFGPTEDLATYPRDAEGDRAKAEAAGVTYLFVPSQAEMFPDAAILVTGVEDPDTRAHGANEGLHLAEFARVCLAEALLLRNLARPTATSDPSPDA